MAQTWGTRKLTLTLQLAIDVNAFTFSDNAALHAIAAAPTKNLLMSKAQKLVNRALDVLLRRHQNHLNDQKALAEIRDLLERTQDSGSGTASEQVKLVRKILQRHQENELSNPQAMNELYRLFAMTTP